jgi:subtilisin
MAVLAAFATPRRPIRRRVHRAMALVAAGLLMAGGSVALPTAAAAGTERATFVVVLKDGVEPRSASRDMARRHGGDIRFVYEHALGGFAITVSENGARGIARDRRVSFVERDQLFTTTAQEVPTGVRRTFASGNTNLDIDGSDDVRVDVDIAIIDTGLDSDHPDLNIAGGADCSGGSPFKSSCTDGTYEDGNGHGTHVGGSAAAIDNGSGVVGMAPGARLFGVKVLGNNGSGYTSWIIAGIDWVTARADIIEVANMSLGCECSSSAQDQAIANSVAAGVTYAVAAGNSDKDAATFSPANHPDVITVSALADFNGLAGGGAAPTCRTDEDDTLANFSNFGELVEIAAPGVCILSTWPGGGVNTISGTSMASPHVAGAAAILASSRSSTSSKADVDAIRDTLVAEGNFDWTDDSGDKVKEPLLDVSDTNVFAPKTLTSSGDGGGTTNNPPTASFTYTCTNLSCDFDGSGSTDDSSVASYSWDFGDTTANATGSTVSHTYEAGGTYTVTLTVTDDAGATDSEAQSVAVTDGSTSITLSANGYKVKGQKKVDLTWSGATTTNVDVVRNGSKVTTTANDGAYTDTVKAGGSYTYTVCEANTKTCSNEAAVTF